MDASDSTLLTKFANGSDHRAFRLLVERYQDLVFSAALRRTGHRGLAEECAQEVLLLLAEKVHLVKNRTNLAGWLHGTSFKLASNKMKSEIRRMRREPQHAEEAKTQPCIWDMPQADHAVVDDALARPDRHRSSEPAIHKDYHSRGSRTNTPRFIGRRS